MVVILKIEEGEVRQVILNEHETNRMEVFLNHITNNQLKLSEPIEGIEIQ